ncbi:hypothetical protein HMPREF1215_00747 [Coprococcus sp. HPP0074]|nr:hypothetical protein HMPREF1215_00747 [Coprococcus sp. HPP0074]
MKNPFKNKTDEELKVLYEQYKEFQKTGVIPDNELGKIRDELYEKLNSGWHVMMMQYLLEVIAERWIKGI